MEIYLSKSEMAELLSDAVAIGVQKGLEATGAAPKYISQNRAHKLFKRSRVRNWVNDGMIAGKPNGNGRCSTVFYEYAKLLELDASDRIFIRKIYVPDNT